MTLGASHAAIGAAITVIIGAPCALLGLPAVIGAAVAIGFYAGRERRQSEEYYRSNRIPPWWWKPRAWRDMAWPALTASITAAVLEVVL